VDLLLSLPRPITGFTKILFSPCSQPIAVTIAVAALVGIEEAYDKLEKIISDGTDEDEP
jgi:hypothetical protein